MAKWNSDIPKLTEEYISKKGLMDLGSTLRDFCKYLGISKETFYKWTDENGEDFKVDFIDSIKNGKEAYRAALIAKSEKSLLELVEGAKSEDTRKEFITTETGEMILAKKIVTTKRAEPNVAATIFALTNLKGEVWKNKQNTDITTNGKDINQQISPAEAAALLKKLEEEV